jgi:signal transduction histidine kinase
MQDFEHKPVVMIVDDNPKNLQILGSLLSQNNYLVIAAQNGQQALEYFDKQHPEIILLDIMMPDMDGFEVCRRLKSKDETKNIPILFITALNDIKDKIKAYAAGGADYITKPFVSEEVLARVNVHLQNSRLLTSLKKGNTDLQELNELKDRFVGIAAHDIRSPLSGAMGIVQLLLDEELGKLNTDQKSVLELVRTAGKQILNLIGDLLDVSIIESGNLKLNFSDTSILEIIQNKVRLHQFAVNTKNIRIKTRLTDIPNIKLDPERFGQVLDNLLSNAAKFSPEDTEILVTLEKNQEHIKVSVTDSGPGISEKDQEKLFGMYRKLTAKPTGGEKSTGLGLAISKKIVDGHQGEITVSSTPGKGAKFTIILPHPLIN